MVIEESSLKFAFPDTAQTIKFDDDEYYRQKFNKLSESKGVDFISINESKILFIEVKNCLGHESENRWRIDPNNKKRPGDMINRDSLDIEVAKKVTMTLAALNGSASWYNDIHAKEYLEDISRNVIASGILNHEREIIIILFLEGDFKSQSRTKNMIMESIRTNIKKKLTWLKCKVSVEDSSTYSGKWFEVIE